MCHISARFDVIILITRIFTDTRRSNTIKKIINLGEKLEFRTGWINRILRRRNVKMKKLSKLFLQHLLVPIRHVVQSFEVVIIPVSYIENTCNVM